MSISGGPRVCTHDGRKRPARCACELWEGGAESGLEQRKSPISSLCRGCRLARGTSR